MEHCRGRPISKFINDKENAVRFSLTEIGALHPNCCRYFNVTDMSINCMDCSVSYRMIFDETTLIRQEHYLHIQCSVLVNISRTQRPFSPVWAAVSAPSSSRSSRRFGSGGAIATRTDHCRPPLAAVTYQRPQRFGVAHQFLVRLRRPRDRLPGSQQDDQARGKRATATSSRRRYRRPSA